MKLPTDQDISGRDVGRAELKELKEVLASGMLFSPKGTKVKAFEKAFAEMYGVPRAVACSSGSAAVHTALKALHLEPGDEVITTPITDMGGIAPILYENLVPVFADIDPRTFNLSAETIKARMTDRTRAIIVVHLFGNPCDMDPIMELARSRNVKVIEDCAQAFLATYKGRKVGTIGDVGAFSLQQGKHITCGEGGIVISNDDNFGRQAFLFVNKGWGYGDPKPDHYFLALNYRLSELCGAMAFAQLGKLEKLVSRRLRSVRAFQRMIKAAREGVQWPYVQRGCQSTYWKYCLLIDEQKLGKDVGQVAAELKEAGIASAPRYIQKPAFECELFTKRRTFGASGWPWNGPAPREPKFNPELFPNTYQVLKTILVLPWSEFYKKEHVDYIAEHLLRATGTR
ncbi:MAG: aminotransferase DegT [Candidatus Lindowbacteria bacterium RIFCSPLOWO2_12_FULL_62_27]|nr:MAG: aminotransferase DegT [Candidatus Lindowbacteria bacterium RIFCSPLOWO2_02_FULL_62_12]OGH59015.1 MAG: aminotransferase DegT [Candidatus Lindowbacteria bacterium RIFCSPLOWO2_12_FULL_62_27]